MNHDCSHSSHRFLSILATLLLLGQSDGLIALELSSEPITPMEPIVTSVKTCFTDNDNGTVVDHLTGLVWLKNANCTETVGGVNKSSGVLAWANALAWTAALDNGNCGLNDGSIASQWRLPNRSELQSLIDHHLSSPALPADHPFTHVQSNYYWSSTTFAPGTDGAWGVNLTDGNVYAGGATFILYVWPVRQQADVSSEQAKADAGL